MNPILKAIEQSREEFIDRFGEKTGKLEEHFHPELGIATYKSQHKIRHFADAPDVIDFLSTSYLNLLKAVVEAGPGEKNPKAMETYATHDAALGHKSCRSSFLTPINEAIEKLEGGR